MMTRSSGALYTVTLAALGMVGVALTQPGLAWSLHAAKAREDVYLFPPPLELRIATLGYHAAVVDMLWVKLRVEFGMHYVERRPFPSAPQYFDALLELEPDYAPAFKYVETMLLYREGGGTPEDARSVRAYLERGIKARPNDHEVWLHYGQFISFMASSYLTSNDEIERWRVDGASALSRAVELGEAPERSLSAANLLSAHGARDAAVRTLERAYALTDDEKTRDIISEKLGALHADDIRERAQLDVGFIDRVWHDHYPFGPRSLALILGPGRSTSGCTGQAPAHDPDCALDWQPQLPSSRGGER